jgi:phytol kinase
MPGMFRKLIDRFLPEMGTLQHLLLPLLFVSVFAALLAAGMKRKGIRTPYTRKSFHFIIFSLAGILQYYYDLHAVSLLGAIVFILVMIAVIAGKRWWFFRALARETDAPHEKKFIILPLLSTAAGGIISNIFFPGTAYIGYFVGGWGDAIGEPVGTRWGRHKYTVPTLFGVRATRSIEGSTAVMLLSTAIATVCLLQITAFSWPLCLLYGFVCGMAAAVVEAVSSHGLDNLTIQVCAAGVLHYIISNYN